MGMLQDEAELFQAYGAEFSPEYRREHWAQGPRMAPSTVPTMPLPAPVSSSQGAAPAPFHPPSSVVPLPVSATPASVPTLSGVGRLPAPSPGGVPSTWQVDPVAHTPGHGPGHGHWPTEPTIHGQLPPVNGMTRNNGHEVWQGGTWVANPAWQGRWHEGEVRTNPDGSRLIFRRGDWVRSDEVSQVVVFSDGSFRVYYLDGSWRVGRRGEHYPLGYPIFHDVATLPIGPRFSLFVSGIDAYRIDNVTNERFRLGQYMPDNRVLVGSVLYHPRHDGSLEWVGPTNVGQNPQADANLAALEEAVKKEAGQAKKTAALAAKTEREETEKLRRHRRRHEESMIPVRGRPAPMVVATPAMPQAIGSMPAYVIAASAPSSPSLEEIAEVTAEAAYEGAQLAIEESQAEAFAAPPVIVEELDMFGGDQMDSGLGYGYRDPRSD